MPESYHSIHLRFGATAPFDQKANWFETWVGLFVRPILETGLVTQYWFTRYGSEQMREVRLRLTTSDYGALKPSICKRIDELGFIDLADEPNETLEGNLANARFLSSNAANPDKLHRAKLFLNYLHSVSALFEACLVGPDADGRFTQEHNQDSNNPHGSIFETAHHLLCNTTGIEPDVIAFLTSNGIAAMASTLYAPAREQSLRNRGVQIKSAVRDRVMF